jgi:putative glycerol-1-phosphate prenyltransferase
LFPGSTHQVCDEADAILLLSLISGRNPDLLIGKHVEVAPQLMRSGLEVIPTGYMLVDGGKTTAVHYVSQTIPIPHDKPELALSTAWAGELMGLRVNYLDAGSGAHQAVPETIVAELGQQTKNPLVVGGGIRSGERAFQLCEAGASVIVVGNALEKSPALVTELLAATHAFNSNHAKIKSKH